MFTLYTEGPAQTVYEAEVGRYVAQVMQQHLGRKGWAWSVLSREGFILAGGGALATREEAEARALDAIRSQAI